MTSHTERHDHHSHSHQHPSGAHHHSSSTSQRALLIVIVLSFCYMLAEIAGSYFANSLALLSDAGHMLTDVAAIGLSLLAVRFASRPATARRTYGFYRLEILAALVNGVTLIVLSVLICIEAWARLRTPENVNGRTLILVSIGGLIVNLFAAWVLSRDHKENLNVHGAFMHVIGDLLGSVAAIIAGLLIVWKGWLWADPIFSFVISFLIIYGSWRLVIDAVNILLEATPSHIDPLAVREQMLTVPGVADIHDLHVWTITSGRYAVTAHVTVNDGLESCRVLRELRELLQDKFALSHSTIQIEDPAFAAVPIQKRSTP